MEYVIIGVVVSFALMVLNRSGSKQVEPLKDGSFELRVHPLYNIVSILGMLMGIIFIIGGIYFRDENLFIMAIFGLIFFLIGIWGFLFYKRYRLKFNENHVSATDFLGKTKSIQWEEITNIRFNKWLGYLYVLNENEKLTIHQHTVGLKQFLTMMEQKTEWNVQDLRIPIN